MYYMLQNFLRTFDKLLSPIYGDNVVLGGATALLIHGLNMSRQSTDLDVIIYNPTYEQKTYIDHIRFFDLIQDRPLDDRYGPVAAKAFKFKHNGLFVDLIIEDGPVPDGLLLYPYKCQHFKIQSVSNVIAAKNKYFFKKERGLVKYIREKEALDFIDLKNSNFNIVNPAPNPDGCSVVSRNITQ